MRVKVWGARGSVPAPGPEMNRYGGNTSCVQLTLSKRRGADPRRRHGIRTLGLDLAARAEGQHPAHPPAPRPHPGPDVLPALLPLRRRRSRSGGRPRRRPRSRTAIARYISAPLSPVEVRELPCSVSFRDTPPSEWQIGSATIRAEAVTHRGPTLGYRITDGDTTRLLHPRPRARPSAPPLADLEPEWISGYDLARDADLLIHDCQYTDEEYPDHVGWGHSADHRHPHLRPPGRGQAAAALPPRPAALRRLPRRPPRHGPRALGRAGRRSRAGRDGHGGRRARGVAGAGGAACAPPPSAVSSSGRRPRLAIRSPAIRSPGRPADLANRSMHRCRRIRPPVQRRRSKSRHRARDFTAAPAYLPTILKPRPPGQGARWARRKRRMRRRYLALLPLAALALLAIPGTAFADATDLNRAIAGKLDASSASTRRG